MGEIQFAGDGKKDIFKEVSTAETPTASGGSGDAIQFAGEGKKDVGAVGVSYGSTDTSQHDPTKSAVPNGGGIHFAGDTNK